MQDWELLLAPLRVMLERSLEDQVGARTGGREVSSMASSERRRHRRYRLEHGNSREPNDLVPWEIVN